MVIINEVRQAGKATIIVSESREGLLKINGHFSTADCGLLADVKGSLNVAQSSGTLFKWLAVDNSIPLIGLLRPTISRMSGEEPEPPGPGIFNYLRTMFAARQWDIRTYPLDEFLVRDGMPSLMMNIEEERFLIALRPVTLEEFISLSDAPDTEESLIEAWLEDKKIDAERPQDRREEDDDYRKGIA